MQRYNIKNVEKSSNHLNPVITSLLDASIFCTSDFVKTVVRDPIPLLNLENIPSPSKSISNLPNLMRCNPSSTMNIEVQTTDTSRTIASFSPRV